MLSPILGASLAAMLFAFAQNLQRQAAGRDEVRDHGPARLMLRLFTTPIWLAGQGVAAMGFVLHAMALTRGGVILVQSVMATTLVYAILIEAALARRRLLPKEVIGSLLVVLGVVLLVGLGRPEATGEFESIPRAMAILVVAVAIGGSALWVSIKRPVGRRTATILGVAAGICFALDAVFLRAAAGSISPLNPSVLVINAVGFAVGSVLGNLVIARAFQSAPLRHVLPGLAAAEPITAMLCGRLVFGEPFAAGPLAVFGVAGGVALLMSGVVLCALGSAFHRNVEGVGAGR